MSTVAGDSSTSQTLDAASLGRQKGMYLAFIDAALDERRKGKNERYTELCSQFRALLPTALAQASTSTQPSYSTPALRCWLDSLANVVSKLDKSHTPLVETILAIPWATMEEPFVVSYVRFIGALVSARPEWLRSVLEKCVKGFKYRSNYTTGAALTMPTITRRILYGRLHALLQLLLSLIPTLSPSLSPLLAASFPSKREPAAAQICYIDNLLALTEYCPALAEDVLGLVIERALNIDVEIQGEADDWEDLDGEGVKVPELAVQDLVDRPAGDDAEDSSDEEGGAFNLDDLDSSDEDAPDSDGEAARKVIEGKKSKNSIETMRKGRDNSAKLDAILKVVFDHIAAAHIVKPTLTVPRSPRKPSNSESDSQEETTPTPEHIPSPSILARRLSLFRTLLDIFDRTLLRTFKTRHTQFLLFYLCSLDPSSSDHFIGVLLARALFETDAAAVTRVAAAGYVASFISRAKFVDQAMTRKVVRLLCEFLEGQMDQQATGTGGGNHLPVFYAVAQAVFYIFCFRWKDLLDEGDDEEIVLETGRRWMMGLETLKRAIASSFNPLKVCAQPVVNQFATIAHKTNFHYCFAIIDANRRTTTARESFPLPASLAQPLRSHSEAPAPLRPRLTSLLSAPTLMAAPLPRQLLVAEEMDSFFPFDPLKLTLSSTYIDAIYREWIADDDSASSDTSSSAASSDSEGEGESEEVSSEIDTDEADYSFGLSPSTHPSSGLRTGGLAVPGSRLPGSEKDTADDEVSRSFEAMSLSPDHSASFGGRRSKTMPVIVI